MIDAAALRALGPPPRAVPLEVRLQLLASRGAALGALVFGVGGVAATLAILAANPLATWRLAHGGQAAPGRLVAVEDLHYTENEVRMFRCRYVFTTPDGAEHPGVCYMRGGQLRTPPPEAAHDPARRPAVRVVYAPGHPESSSIEGLSLRPFSLFGFALLMAPALVGLLILGFQLASGLRKIRLLARGEAAEATLVSCRSAGDYEGTTEQPFAEFRDHRLTRNNPGTPAAALGEPPAELMRVMKLFAGFWTGLVILVGGSGLVILSLMIWDTLHNHPGPLLRQGKLTEPGKSLLGTVVFLAVWVLFTAVSLWVGRRLAKEGPGLFLPSQSSPKIQCFFDLRLPDGRVIRARQTVTFDGRLGAGAAEPVLSDPARPEKALLLNGLSPPVLLSDFGEWRATGGPAPALRAVLIIACVAAGPAVGWGIWNLL